MVHPTLNDSYGVFDTFLFHRLFSHFFFREHGFQQLNDVFFRKKEKYIGKLFIFS